MRITAEQVLTGLFALAAALLLIGSLLVWLRLLRSLSPHSRGRATGSELAAYSPTLAGQINLLLGSVPHGAAPIRAPDRCYHRPPGYLRLEACLAMALFGAVAGAGLRLSTRSTGPTRLLRGGSKR